ncbi:MAG: MATE family efflux transporter [Lachnospiraceae bacterium]|nr:MATE family efflux transporter [Lachnospiraceae bacterium]
MIDGIFKKTSNVQIVVSMTASISMIIDNVFISRFMGLNAVAAAGLITPVLMIILAFSGVLSAGGQLVIGEKMGRGDKSGAIGSVSLCVVLIGLSALIIMVGSYLFTDQICDFLGAQPGSELLEDAGQYLRGYVIGAPGIIGMLSMIPIMNIDGDKKRSFVCAWTVTITDILLDILAVLVFPKSLFAIALASGISYLVALVVMGGHFFRKDDKYVLKIRLKAIPWGETTAIFLRGFPAALQKLLRTALSFTVNQILLAVGGAIALASFSIVSNIGNLLNSVGQGLSAATLTISGVLYGEKIRKNLSDLYKAFIKYSVVWNLIMVALTFVGADLLVSIFMSAKKVDVPAVVWGLRIFSLDFVFYSICICAKSYYQGVKRMAVNYIITVVEGFCCIALFTWIFGMLFGFYGVCLGYGIGDAVSLLSIVAGVWITNKRFPKTADDYLLLEEGQVLPDNRVFTAQVPDQAAAASVSEQAAAFVAAHCPLTDREQLARQTAVLIEDLSKDLLEKGFPLVKKAAMEVTVLCEDEALTLLINDNCTGFSVAESVYGASDDGHSGTMDAALVNKMEHYRVLGINKTKIMMA